VSGRINPDGKLSRMGRCALTYARYGFAIFPQRQDKVALVKWGELAGPPSHETVAEWWRRWPEANIACSCGPSGLVVVDCDGELGRAGMVALAEAFGDWPATLRQASARGEHLLYRCPDPPPGGRSGLIAAGVDVKGRGGCFTLAPSLHASGVRYEWLTEGPLADAPAWLTLRLERAEAARREMRTSRAPRLEPRVGGQGATRYGEAALRGILGRLSAATHPGRRDALNVASLLVGHLVAGGEIGEALAERELLEAGAAIFAQGPPPEAGEVWRTVRDGLADGQRDPRGAPGERTRVAAPQRPKAPPRPRYG
jgi:hypothetical protein